MKPYVIQNPGFHGLNTIDSLADTDGRFGLVMDNVVFDRAGRLAHKEPWREPAANTFPGTTERVNFAYEYIPASGGFAGLPLVVASDEDGNLDIQANALTLGHSWFAATLPGTRSTSASGTAGFWKGTNFEGQAYLWQRGTMPKVTTDTLAANDVATGAGDPPPPAGVATFAFGHFFVADTGLNGLAPGYPDGNKVLYWSGFRAPTQWGAGGTGGSGSQDLSSLFKNPDDGIVGIAEHNGFLVVLCRHCILIFDFGNISLGNLVPSFNAATLVDRIDGVGCVHQDTIQSTGDDLVWLSFGGVHSLGRQIDQKSNPLGDVSLLIQDDIQDITRTAGTGQGTRSIKSAWWPERQWYLLSFPNQGVTYVFDHSVRTEAGTPRVTRWNDFAITSFISETRIDLTSGGFAAGIEPFMRGAFFLNGSDIIVGRYSNVSSVGTPYGGNGVFQTPFMDLGDPTMEKHLKNAVLALFSTDAAATVTVECLQDYDTVVVWDETQPVGATGRPVPTPFGLGGSGHLVSLRITFNTNTADLALQRVGIYAKPGRKSFGV